MREEPEVVRIDIDAAGVVRWQGAALAGPEELAARMAAAAAQPAEAVAARVAHLREPGGHGGGYSQESGHQWSLVVISGHQWSLVVISGH